MQGCGARAWAERARGGNQLPTGWAAHPHLQRCHHFLLCLRHVVHQGRLWHCVCRHHLAAGVLRRVCSAICDAATLQESDVQHRERDPFQHSGLPCPCLTPQGHVHRPCTWDLFGDIYTCKLKVRWQACLYMMINELQILLKSSTVWSCFLLGGGAKRECY